MAEAPGHCSSAEQEVLLRDQGDGLATPWTADQTQHPETPNQDEAVVVDEAVGSTDPSQEPQRLLQTSVPPELDEDEGFSDWTQKSEPPQQQQFQGFGEPGAGGQLSPSERPEQPPDRPHLCTCEDEEGEAGSPVRDGREDLGSGPCGEPQETLHPAEEAGEKNPEQPGAPCPREQDPGHDSPPLSPGATLLHRTESLNRAIERSHSVKKTQPALPVSKIDERLEQYTQAVETAGRTPKLTRQTSIELPSMTVADTKNLWESGGVQWGDRTPACKDIVAGDMSKKQLWERSGSPSPSVAKSTPSGKRYKFVATGHGKYEKVLVDEDSGPVAPL